MQKVVLITGTSTGLGLSLSILLAKNNFTVYASMRDTNKADLLLNRATEEGVKINIVSLDVSIVDSVQSCVDNIIAKEGKIDILVNNAGVGFAKSTEQASYDEIDWVTDVNYTGVVRCTKAVLPYMRKQQNGHIINITSVGALVGQPFNELYCGAKFAVEGYTEALASYLTNAFGIHFSLVEPGGISTEFMKSAVANSTENNAFIEDEYLPILQQYLTIGRERSQNTEVSVYQTPDEVAEVVWQIIDSENPPLRSRTSQWSEAFCELKTQADPDGMKLLAKVKKDFLGNE